jgi:thioredoxin-like negative regulator of GroEL
VSPKLYIILSVLLAAGACSDFGEEGAEGFQEAAVHQSEELPRMIAIHASYCSVCSEMKPLLESLVNQCDKKDVRVDVFDVSSEENEYLLDEHRVVALPTYLFVDGAGREVARLVGKQPDSTLRQALGALRGEECPGLGRVKAKEKLN